VLTRQLADTTWTDGLSGGFDAVLTATAMHWFPAPALAGVYAGVARLLRSGGVFVNADHVPVAEPVLRAAADSLHQQRFERAGAVWRRGNDAIVVAVRA
jgi:SAM-dependent methyltransferase